MKTSMYAIFAFCLALSLGIGYEIAKPANHSGSYEQLKLKPGETQCVQRIDSAIVCFTPDLPAEEDEQSSLSNQSAKPPAKKKRTSRQMKDVLWKIDTDKIEWDFNPIVLSLGNSEFYTVEALEAKDEHGRQFHFTWRDEGKTFRDHWIITPEDCATPNAIPCGPDSVLNGESK